MSQSDAISGYGTDIHPAAIRYFRCKDIRNLFGRTCFLMYFCK